MADICLPSIHQPFFLICLFRFYQPADRARVEIALGFLDQAVGLFDGDADHPIRPMGDERIGHFFEQLRYPDLFFRNYNGRVPILFIQENIYQNIW